MFLEISNNICMAFSECILYFITKTKEEEEKEKREGRIKTGRKKREIKPYMHRGKKAVGGEVAIL